MSPRVTPTPAVGLFVRISPQLQAKLRELADEEEISVSEFVRSCLEASAKFREMLRGVK